MATQRRYHTRSRSIFPFFRLPAELRDAVYDAYHPSPDIKVVKSTKMTVAPGILRVSGLGGDELGPILKLCHINRQIRQEVLQRLLARKTAVVRAADLKQLINLISSEVRNRLSSMYLQGFSMTPLDSSWYQGFAEESVLERRGVLAFDRDAVFDLSVNLKVEFPALRQLQVRLHGLDCSNPDFVESINTILHSTNGPHLALLQSLKGVMWLCNLRGLEAFYLDKDHWCEACDKLHNIEVQAIERYIREQVVGTV
ncbi:hypothetical protein NA57DRAFT_75894 [Rhizodiscina lignyota]|uniref:Uncharacterized protein n=1 Tax=Rhizodiscina lignyota TaxID=1504668 RepID=A0A9P4IHP4_9PEZI|nr:hypothetical protein NA57DRAFT_75894 [Rhizodiscina lignyota]